VSEAGSSISADVIRGYVDTMILSVLQPAPSYGYEISRRIRETTGGTYAMKETTLYSAFARLERQGLVTPFPGAVTHGRARTYYLITEAGRVYYKAKCREWRLTQAVISQFIDEDKVA
jgi:PadR family transcriptional regulator PadR